MGLRQQALIVVPLIISVLAGAFGVLGYFMEIAFGMPSRLCMPPALRGVGVIVLALGFLFMGWLFRYRKPAEILASTYVTMRKSIGRTRPDDASARIEPLILQGPQRHVRHPLYFAVVVLLLGWCSTTRLSSLWHFSSFSGSTLWSSDSKKRNSRLCTGGSTRLTPSPCRDSFHR